jgi:hypothetical protein
MTAMSVQSSESFIIGIPVALIYLLMIFASLRAKSESSSGETSSKTQHEIEIATHIPEDEDKHENDFWKYIDINKVQQEVSNDFIHIPVLLLMKC